MSHFERDRLPAVVDDIHRRAIASEVAHLGLITPGSDGWDSWETLTTATRTPEAKALLAGHILDCVEFEGTTDFGNIFSKRGNRLNSVWATAASRRHFTEQPLQPHARQVVVQNGEDFAHVFLIPGQRPMVVGDHHYQAALKAANPDSLYNENFVLKTATFKFGPEAVVPLSEPTAAEMIGALETEQCWIAQSPEASA